MTEQSDFMPYEKARTSLTDPDEVYRAEIRNAQKTWTGDQVGDLMMMLNERDRRLSLKWDTVPTYVQQMLINKHRVWAEEFNRWADEQYGRLPDRYR